ncbi:hypothetical protein KIW84_042259 [Lathyrus oleraceus]|uniref:non-specific serine/threonine protein kinase n=1 Tax=Pisum sativum TaxID=3888 RepID=A0A9D4XAS6_PEA|nr:hypothetical protein KIW84_042259 [Pisum sativum]
MLVLNRIHTANQHVPSQCLFYSSPARYQIVSILVDRCSDPDKRTRKFACFAIGNAAYHNDVLYEELRRSIPHLANLLQKAEEDKTKANAASALSDLVRNSDRLCEDIVSKGAVQSLLKLISDYAASALNPSRNDSTNESPLKIALFSLAKMCAHPLCRQFIRSSPLFPVIGRLQQSPESSLAKYVGHISPQCPKPKKENQSGGKVFALPGSETSADDRLIRGTLW